MFQNRRRSLSAPNLMLLDQIPLSQQNSFGALRGPGSGNDLDIGNVIGELGLTNIQPSFADFRKQEQLALPAFSISQHGGRNRGHTVALGDLGSRELSEILQNSEFLESPLPSPGPFKQDMSIIDEDDEDAPADKLDRKQAHVLSEKKRRLIMKDKFDELTRLLPPISDKPSKIDILQRAIEFIVLMRKEMERLQLENMDLKQTFFNEMQKQQLHQMQLGMQPPALSPMASLQGPISPQVMQQQGAGLMFGPQSPQVLGAQAMHMTPQPGQLFQFPPQ